MTQKKKVLAKRATIYLGSIPLEVFWLVELNQYRLSQTQVLEAIKVSDNWLTRLRKESRKAFEALQSKGFTGLQVEAYFIEEGNRGTKFAKTLSINDATLIWSWFNRQGNELAADILEVCAIEAIERRADAAFNIQRTEEERNEQMIVRLSGKQTRRQLTDAIKSYIDRHPELSDNKKQWLYVNASQQVVKVVFGRLAKKLATDLGVHPDRLRDALTTEELLLLQEVEDTAVRLIDLRDLDPEEAVKQCRERLLIPVQARAIKGK